MWDSVVIGRGEKGNSAVKVFAIPGDHDITQNSVSYWITNVYLGLGMTVFKNTKTGDELHKLIFTHAPLEEINAFLLKSFLENVAVDVLQTATSRALACEFEKGKAAKIAEIRGVLDL